MKIGITIPNYYEEFLRKIANLNKSNPTKVCSLIVQNFLSYNLKQKKFPKFKKFITIEFENETVSQRSSDSYFSDNSSGSLDKNCEQLTFTRAQLDKIFADVPEDPEDIGLPFEYDSED